MGEPSRPDQRSTEALLYREWYGSMRWKRRRLAQLRADPFCVMCRRLGVYAAATVADHVEPHKGDPVSFWTGELQSLCKPHHDRDKQRAEIMATPLRVDADGWPFVEGARPRGAYRQGG